MKSIYNFTIGELVYAIRKINGLTQVEYSKQLGVVQSTISKVEKDVFDDVPFSLISKISLDFKVPLQHFQVGHLPLRKTTQMTKAVPKHYVKDGVFNSKTIFHILKVLESSYGTKIYKELKLPYQLLSLSNLTYSYEFINKLYSLVKTKLPEAIGKIEIDASSENAPEIITKYLKSLNGIKIVEEKSSNKTQLSYLIQINSELQELNNIYASILELELALLFNVKTSSKQTTASDEFKFTLELLSA